MERFEVPEKWAWLQLGDIADVMLGKTPRRADYATSGIKVVKFRDVSQRGIDWTNDDSGFVTRASTSAEDLRFLSLGDVLLTASAHNADSIGKKACVVSELPGKFDRVAFVGELLCARANQRTVLPRWFLAWFQSESGFAAVSDKVDGVHLTQGRAREIDIPVPPLAEQQRIVTIMEVFTSRAHELVDQTRSLTDAVDQAVAALYERIIAGAAYRLFGQVAKLVRRAVKTTPSGQYGEMGIRSFGKGTFPKPVVTGAQLGKKRVFRIRIGDLVFMNVFAWEGAVAVAQADDDGRVGSHRFLSHEVDSDLATAEFLCFHFLTPQGLEDIAAASPGSAGRNRTLGIEKLAHIEVPVPGIEDQRRFARMIRLQHELRHLQGQVESELKAFTPALLAKAFRGQL